MSLKKFALAGGVAATLMAGTAYASVIDRPFFQVLGVVVVWGADSTGTAPVVSDFVLLTPASGSEGADLISGDVRAVVTGSLDPISATGAGGAGSDVADPTSGGVYADANSDGILNAGDTLSAFGIDATTDVDGIVGPAQHTSSFYVASNSAFDIYATSGGLTASGDFGSLGLDAIGLEMTIDQDGTVNADGSGLAFGNNAQNPTTIALGSNVLEAAVTNLGHIESATPVKVFDGTARTAATPGSLSQQSVRFNNVYSLDMGGTGYDLSMGAGTISADVTYTIFVP